MDDGDADLIVLVELQERARERLDRTLYIGLDDDVEVLDVAFLDLVEEVVERDLLALDEVVALALDAGLGDGAGLLLLEHGEDVAGFRHVIEAEDLDRYGRAGLLDVLAAVVDHGADLAVRRAADDRVADAQRAVLDEDRRDRAAALVELGLDDDAARIAVRVGLELLDFGDEQDHLEEVIDANLLLSRDRDHDRVSAVFLRHEALLHELLLDAVRVGARLIDLVDRYDDRHACRLRMVDGLDRLRHDAVVCGDDEDRDIRDLGAARTHGRECLMARRVEEDDLLALAVDLISTDVLRDAAGLMRLDMRVADTVEQRRLAVVDMAHDRDDRRAELQRLRVVLDLRDFRRVDLWRQLFARHAEFRSHEGGRIKVDFLVDRRHDAHHEELLDDFRRRVAHLGREVLDGNRLRQLDVLRMRDLDLRCLLAAALVVAAPAVAVVLAAEAVVTVIAVVTAAALVAATVAAVVAIAAAVIVATAIAVAVAAVIAAVIVARAVAARSGAVATIVATIMIAVAVIAARIAAALVTLIAAVIAVVLLAGLRLLGALLCRLCGRLLRSRCCRSLCLRLSALVAQRILDGRALFFADTREIVGSLELIALEDIQNDFAIRVELFRELVNSIFGH